MDGIFYYELSEYERILKQNKNDLSEGESHYYHDRPKYLEWLQGTDDDKLKKLANLRQSIAKEEALVKQFKTLNVQSIKDMQKFPSNIQPASDECMRCRSSHPSDRRTVFQKTYPINYESRCWAYAGKELIVWQCTRCNLYYYISHTIGDRCLV